MNTVRREVLRNAFSRTLEEYLLKNNSATQIYRCRYRCPYFVQNRNFTLLDSSLKFETGVSRLAVGAPRCRARSKVREAAGLPEDQRWNLRCTNLLTKTV